jgi:FkbM family methyltransferase
MNVLKTLKKRARLSVTTPLKAALSSNGYEIVPKIPNPFSKLQISEIIDVGVANGTDILLQSFPGAKFHWVEANPQYYPFIENNLMKTYRGQLYKCAAGASQCHAQLALAADISSFLERSSYDLSTSDKLDVEIKPLDQIIPVRQLGDDFLLKIDTEGYELEVLKGATQILQKARYVMLEVRLKDIKTYNASDLIVFLRQQGFLWKDVVSVAHRPWGVNFMDVLFEKHTEGR